MGYVVSTESHFYRLPRVNKTFIHPVWKPNMETRKISLVLPETTDIWIKLTRNLNV